MIVGAAVLGASALGSGLSLVLASTGGKSVKYWSKGAPFEYVSASSDSGTKYWINGQLPTVRNKTRQWRYRRGS